MAVSISPKSFLGLAAISYVVYIILYSLFVSRRNAAKARELGCQEPPCEKNRLPFGYDQAQRFGKADKAMEMPTDMVRRFDEVGAYTHRFNMLGMTGFRTAEPKNIQAILATQFADFDLGPLRAKTFWPLLGSGIFTSDGDGWKHSRAMLRPQFTRDQISDLDLEETHVQNMMKVLDSKKRPNNVIETDLLPYFFNLTLDSATEFLIGESTNSQLVELGYQATSNRTGHSATKFGSAFDFALKGLAARGRLMNFYWLHNPKEFRDASRFAHEFVDKFVQHALTKSAEEKAVGGDSKYTLLDALVEETRDPIRLRSELLHILLAGRDTTASHLGWVFHYLSRDPHRYQKLRQAILNDFGTYHEPHSRITFAKLKDCRYLRYVNDEALRLNPLVPLNSRRSNKDTTLPTGGGPDGRSPIFVPSGTEVNYSVHTMQRRKDIWGQDADDFVPERWEGRKPGWEYLPFNGGPRICIGQQFALTEASYVIVRLMQRYDQMESLLGKDEVVKHNLHLTNSIGNGVKVRLHVAAPGT
ncbi:cytochrome P450 alkane hydroxylase-like protein [Xylariaceae sp. FL1272]|nr:cytochrome P450 alkane hydroxylase-like protein [Xylariaceae sp. FL1272]